jgi:multidrug resistance efflux pump
MIFNTKKTHFKKKLKDVEKMDWDWTFKLHKTKLLKEDIRKEHDRVVERIDALEAQLKANNKKETKEELTKQKEGSENDLKNIKSQLDQLDSEITQTQAGIDGLKELKKMTQDYIKSL